MNFKPHDFTFRGRLLGNSHFTTADKAERRLAARTDGQKESPLGGLWNHTSLTGVPAVVDLTRSIEWEQLCLDA